LRDTNPHLDPMTIQEIEPGTRLETTLDVPGGIHLPVLLARGVQAGPRIAILGGVHGDEYEGVVAAASVWHDTDPTDLRGSLVVVTVANPPAFEAGVRASPLDGLNLARTFPGSLTGSVTERIAHILSESVIKPADFLLDLHSAGQHYAMPLLAGAYAADNDLGRRCEAAALAFGAPVYWAHPDVAPGRSLTVAVEAGIPNLYVECGGGGRVRPGDLRAYRDGVRRVLVHLGCLSTDACGPAPKPELRLRSTGDLDTWLAVSHAGILVERVAVLDRVSAGQTLGEVIDDRGRLLERLSAPFDGVVVMARRTARVRPGDGAYMVALPDELEDSTR
jgi:predicted deacylase